MAQLAQRLQAPFREGTFSALNNRNFRLYFFGQLLSMSGTWMQNVAQSYLVFQLTKSEFMLGLVFCATGIPILLISPFAGVVVEHIPRRRLLMVTQSIQMTLAFVLAALVFTGTVQTWHIFGLALILGFTNAFDGPARQTIVGDLVGLKNLPSGIALNSMIVNGSRVFGPTLAGIFLVSVGPAWCFFVNGISFLFVLFSLSMITLPSPEKSKEKTRPIFEFKEGLRFARRSQVISGLLLLAAVGGMFSWSLISIFSAFADRMLLSPKEGLAIMSATNGLGALMAGIVVTYFTRIMGRGQYIAVMAFGTSLSMLMLAHTVTIPAAALMSFIAGFCVISFFVTINTTLQITIPPQFRGRVLSLYTLSIMGLTPFGSLALGWLAEQIRTPNAMTFYAVLSGLLSALILYLFRAVLHTR